MRYEFDRRAGTAYAAGTVTFSDVLAEEPEQLTLPVNLRWTAEGKPVRTVSYHKDFSKASKQVVHVRTLTWPTVEVTGTVGSLVVGDEPGEIQFRQLTHEKTRVIVLRRPTGEPPTEGGMG